MEISGIETITFLQEPFINYDSIILHCLLDQVNEFNDFGLELFCANLDHLTNREIFDNIRAVKRLYELYKTEKHDPIPINEFNQVIGLRNEFAIDIYSGKKEIECIVIENRAANLYDDNWLNIKFEDEQIKIIKNQKEKLIKNFL